MTVRGSYLQIPLDSWIEAQHYVGKLKDGQRPTWIKLYLRLLDHDRLAEVEPMCRFVYVGLLLCAAKTNNLIPSKANWIANQLSMSTEDVKVAVKCLVKIGLVKPLTEAQSRVALDELYARLEEKESKRESKKDSSPGPFEARDDASQALAFINANLRGAA